MNKVLACLGTAVLLAAVGLPLAAQTDTTVERGQPERHGRAWVEVTECSAPVAPGGKLTVRVDAGTVRVEPGAGHRMECQVRLAIYTRSEQEARQVLSQYRLTVRRVTGGGAYLAGAFRSGSSSFASRSITYRIQVPRRFDLDVETQGGNIIVEELDGEFLAATAGGEIRAGAVQGPVRVETAGGNIEIGSIGGPLQARTAGGCVRIGDVQGNAIVESGGGHVILGRIQGEAQAETAGGDIVVRGASDDVSLQTAGGQIRVGEIRGSLRAVTAGGSIRLDSAQGPIRVETAGGSIDLYQVQSTVDAATAAGSIVAQISATSESFAASALQTAIGDVEVYLPADLPLNIDATIDVAAGYKISSDFPIQIEGGESRYQPTRLRGYGPLNGGGATLRIHTVAGNIRILKIDQARLERMRRQQDLHWKRWRELHQRQQERRHEREEDREQR